MNIQTYLKKHPEKRGEIASSLGVSVAYVYQWMRGIRPVPVQYCAAIEKVTVGAVSRKDLRPDDWQEIWPELIDSCLNFTCSS